MTKEEAVRIWVNDLDEMPSIFIKQLSEAHPIEWCELAASEDDNENFMWGTAFHIKNQPWIEDKIAEHADEVYEIGFSVFHHQYGGIWLTIRGCGFDFYEKLWTPLYDLLEINLHEITL